MQWKAGKKNDIIADHLGFLYSQVPDDPDCDFFNGEMICRLILFSFIPNIFREKRGIGQETTLCH